MDARREILDAYSDSCYASRFWICKEKVDTRREAGRRELAGWDAAGFATWPFLASSPIGPIEGRGRRWRAYKSPRGARSLPCYLSTLWIRALSYCAADPACKDAKLILFIYVLEPRAEWVYKEAR